MTRRAAILRMHEGLRTRENAALHWKVVIMQPSQSEDLDANSSRNWLWPHIGANYHLMYFADVEEQSS